MNKNEFKKIIESFFEDEAKKEILHYKEAQLQFNLALYLSKKIKDFEVCLEYTSYKDDKKLSETDIILINKDGGYIPIELKYKTLSLGMKNNFDLKNQSAQDLGRYNFIKDIKRLEELKYTKINAEESIINPNLKKYLFGFAVFLTNDKSYWEIQHNNVGQGVNYKSFCIGDNDTLKGELKVVNKKNKSKIKNIRLRDIYKCNWKEYHEFSAYKKNAIFKYLIITVE